MVDFYPYRKPVIVLTGFFGHGRGRMVFKAIFLITYLTGYGYSMHKQ
jgi:hypothetical protein